ncbi:MAG: hypothetical protein QNJ88_00085 [Acidimicrobiia bacterium]|nr:hypothetical protein [Acidimicrobiia bacterium]
MAPSSTPGRLPLLALAIAAAVSIGVLMVATPPEQATTPPTGQTQVAPLAEPADAPADVLVPGDMGRVLSPFMAILEGDIAHGGENRSVWRASSDGLSYSATGD